MSQTDLRGAFEIFQTNFKALDEPKKVEKLNRIMTFLQQQNAVKPLIAFNELRMCYVAGDLPRSERVLNEFLAWLSISDYLEHPLVAHVIAKG
jgi:hypothetical protein